MKRIQTIFLCVMLVTATAWLSGCYKDKGNYDYTAINKVIISDPASLVNISLRLNDTLRLKPVITQTIETKEDSLAFKWTVYEIAADGGPSPYITLTTARNLEQVIKGPNFILGRNYRIILEVTDKKTGVTFYLYYMASVVNEFAQGWMELEEISSNTDLSLILPDGRVFHNLYSSLNTTPLGKPVKLEIAPNSITDGLSNTGRRLYVLAENTGLELDYQTLVKKFNYTDLFFAPPSPVKPEMMNWTTSNGVAVNNGLVHVNLVGGFPGLKKWGEKLLSVTGNFNYKAAPFVAGGTTYVAVVYDNTNKRFCYVSSAVGGSATVLNAFPANASNTSIFDMNNVGMTMLYMDSANVVRDYNAIMKDDANNPYLFRFKTVSTTAAPVITLQKMAMNAPNILNMTAAAGSTITPHLFYSVANKVSRYETTSNTTTDLYTFPAGENVTKMKFQGIVPGATTSRLAVSTWNGTEGKVYYFTVSAVGDFNTYTNVFGGFAKIVDLAYKVVGT